MLQQVTFGFEDIEFIRPDGNGFDRIKTVIWRDRDFQAWVREVGTETALIGLVGLGGTCDRVVRPVEGSSCWAASTVRGRVRVDGFGCVGGPVEGGTPTRRMGQRNMSTEHPNGSHA